MVFEANITTLCLREAQTCALPRFRDSELEINTMTLKFEGDQDILNIFTLKKSC